jgi:hypothetical protein
VNPHIPKQVAWFTYTHESRLALLASSVAAPVRLTGYQFATSGLIRLPKFDLPSLSNTNLPRARCGMFPECSLDVH